MIISAGFVLVRKEDNDEYKFLLLRSYSHYDFPKGKQDLNETILETAFRETQEEAGFSKQDFSLPWGEVSYTTEPYTSPKKTATYFIGLTTRSDVKLLPNPTTGRMEHQGYKWATYKEGLELVVPRISAVLTWANTLIAER